MRKAITMFAALLLMNVPLSGLQAQEMTAEQAYARIQGFVKQGDWAAVYDSYSDTGKEILDVTNSSGLTVYLVFGDSGAPAGFAALSGRDKFAKVMETNQKNIPEPNYHDFSPENQVIKSVKRGQNEVLLQVKDPSSKTYDVLMIKAKNGAWTIGYKDGDKLKADPVFKLMKAEKEGSKVELEKYMAEMEKAMKRQSND